MTECKNVPEGTLELVRSKMQSEQKLEAYRRIGGFVVALGDFEADPETAFLISFTPLRATEPVNEKEQENEGNQEEPSHSPRGQHVRSR